MPEKNDIKNIRIKLNAETFKKYLGIWKNSQKGKGLKYSDKYFVEKLNEIHNGKPLKSDTTIRQWKTTTNPKDITKSEYLESVCKILKIKKSLFKFEKDKPYYFKGKLWVNPEWALEHFNYDLKAFMFVSDFLKDKHLFDFIKTKERQNIISKCKKIDKGLEGAWFSFYDRDRKAYYKASPELLGLITDTYYKSRLFIYKEFSDLSLDEVKEIVKNNKTPLAHVLSLSENSILSIKSI